MTLHRKSEITTNFNFANLKAQLHLVAIAVLVVWKDHVYMTAPQKIWKETAPSTIIIFELCLNGRLLQK